MIWRSQTPPEDLGHRPASTLWESHGSLHFLLLSIITSPFMLELFHRMCAIARQNPALISDIVRDPNPVGE